MQAAIIFLRRIYGNDSVTYLGGLTTYYPKLLSEIPVFSLSIGRISEHCRGARHACMPAGRPARMNACSCGIAAPHRQL